MMAKRHPWGTRWGQGTTSGKALREGGAWYVQRVARWPTWLKYVSVGVKGKLYGQGDWVHHIKLKKPYFEP
jgi:hypothetical protein